MQTMKPFVVTTIALVGLAGLLAGCTTPSGQPDYTGSGALIGGGSGAAIGALADREAPGVGALIGGAAGLITGGLIGHTLDQQDQARLQRSSPPAYAAAPPSPPPPSLADIEAMTRSGVSDDVIIGQINSSHAFCTLDANAILDLTRAGVSQRVISYMIGTSNSVVSQAPPPPQAETVVVAPGPGYVWVRGEWIWNGGTWVWVGGRWVLPPYPHACWVGPHWEHRTYGWHRVPGHWG